MSRFQRIIVFLSLFVPGFAAISQDLPYQQGLEPVALSPDEQFVLMNVPELQLPERYKGDQAPLLPVSVDNSTQPYYRSITWQSGYECGQSAGIAFNFTYEIDRLRGVPANVAANQYPTHFTWDFLNNANNYTGVSFFDSWEIVKACGNMNVTDYGGGLNTGGYTRWISGYDVYYNGMHNRLNSVKAIRVDTPEGLMTLKYWLFDHLEGAAVGGVGNIYGQYFGPPVPTLPAGTPEAGKYVQTNWGGSPSHAWTICGYNDSIRYDFNGDGQYTNHIDINNDGVVDMHDWEKGGLKFSNGYAGPGWANSGFCYTMYKNLADRIGLGGIWNHTVYVLDVKATCQPPLTMKIALKHTSRNRLKVTAGINPDVSATVPSQILEFPIFNYQGGDLYMQGGTTEADKTIEFGLDLAPLVSQLNPGQPAKYFLQVQENDPSSGATGEIVGWSLIDYTGGSPVLTAYPGSNIPIQNNAVTRLGITYGLNYNKPVITNPSLPPAQLYQPYSVTLNASGGTPPYLWDAKLDYPETTSPAVFPVVTAQQLTLTNNNTGYAIKTLGFEFPYYKKTVNKVYVYADGYILFDDQPYTWPYIVDKTLLFRQTAILAPFMGDLAIYPSSSQGIWYEGGSNYAIFRWKASFNGMQGSTNLNFAVKLYANGTIEYYYGDMLFPSGTAWTGGLSSGDNKNYQYTAFHNGSVTPNTLDKFTTCGFPPEMQLSEEGVFSGTPTHSYQNLPVKFIVTDNNNISSIKTLAFNTYGLLVNQSVLSGGDSLIEYGETAYISLSLNNIGTTPLNLLNFSITETDPYITLTDSTQAVATIAGGATLTLPNAFSFQVSPAVPNHHEFTITLQVQSQEQTFQRPLPLTAFAPVFRITQTVFDDGDNGMPDPGEGADLLLTYKNEGGAKAASVTIQLTSLDTNLVINTSTASIPLLKPDSSSTLVFHATAGPQASLEHLYEIAANLTAANNFSRSDTVRLFAGEIVEDFETGDFTRFPWFGGGQTPWTMQDIVVQEGVFSARSGFIVDNMDTKLMIGVNVLAAGPISFYKYVSCEYDPSGNKDYDYMAFYIDNFEMARWDGDNPWSLETFQVPAGYHILSWVYHKDYSVSAGWDGCVLDYVRFPLIAGATPDLAVTPDLIGVTLQTGQDTTVNVLVTNAGGGILSYGTLVFDTAANKKESHPFDHLTGSYVTCATDGFVPGQPLTWMFTVYNPSSSTENLKDIRFDVPPGVTITGATPFTGGSLGDLAFLGTPGNGPVLRWHGESTGGAGVLKPGESAVATLTGTIEELCLNDIFVVYVLGGDNSGNAPHTATGNVRIRNYGLANTWVSLTDPAGSLTAGQTDTVKVTIRAAGMSSGIYRCIVAVRDAWNNKAVIPVTLNIPFPVGSGKTLPGASSFCTVSPNPFSETTLIHCHPAGAGPVRMELFTTGGLRIRSWHADYPGTGPLVFSWDGTDENGNSMPAGVYFARLQSGDLTGSVKIILVR